MIPRALAALAALALVVVVSSQATDCTGPITSSTGDSYNIAALIGVTKCGLCDVAGFCEVEQWYDNCVGKFASATGMPNGQGVELAYPNGEFGRAGVVQILCKPGAGNADNVRIQNDGNLALIDSGLACSGGGPGSGKVSPGGVILIILICIIFVYLVGGAIFMRFVRGAEIGPDLIPNRDIWITIPGLVIEGALFTVATVKGLIGRLTGGSS